MYVSTISCYCFIKVSSHYDQDFYEIISLGTTTHIFPHSLLK